MLLFAAPVQRRGLFVSQPCTPDVVLAQQAASSPMWVPACRGGAVHGDRGMRGIPPPAPCAHPRPWQEHTEDQCWALCPALIQGRMPTAFPKSPHLAPKQQHVWGRVAHACWPQGEVQVCTCMATSLPEVPALSPPAGHRSPQPGGAGAPLICRRLKQEPGTPMVLLG